MELSIRDILQINATVIAGVFILLSLMFSGNSSFEGLKELGLFIYFVGGFFSMSCFLALFAELATDEIKKKSYHRTSKKIMTAGFVVLFLGFAIIGLYFVISR